MTDCARCKRTLDATEVEYSSKVIPQPGKPYEIWCADCLGKSPCYSNEK